MVQNVIVGLGNPGPQFETTRHNAGFDVMRSLAGAAQFVHDQTSQADVHIVEIAGKSVCLACPTTGMNSSGEAAKALLEQFSLPSSALLLIYDDVSLPMGRLRFQHNGGAGGHHGIESTIEQLGGSKEFDRLKVGVGPDPGGATRYQFVLAPMTNDELEFFGRVRAASVDAVKIWLESGIDAAMSKINGRKFD